MNNAKVLEFNELIHVGRDEIIWVEVIGEKHCRSMQYGGGADGGSEGQEFFHDPNSGELYAFIGNTDEYGKTWRCWKGCPMFVEMVKEGWPEMSNMEILMEANKHLDWVTSHIPMKEEALTPEEILGNSIHRMADMTNFMICQLIEKLEG